MTCPLKKRLRQSKRSASILLITDRNAEVVSAVGTSKSPFPNVLDSDPEYVQKAIRNAGFELTSKTITNNPPLSMRQHAPACASVVSFVYQVTLGIKSKMLSNQLISGGIHL